MKRTKLSQVKSGRKTRSCHTLTELLRAGGFTPIKMETSNLSLEPISRVVKIVGIVLPVPFAPGEIIIHVLLSEKWKMYLKKLKDLSISVSGNCMTIRA